MTETPAELRARARRYEEGAMSPRTSPALADRWMALADIDRATAEVLETAHLDDDEALEDGSTRASAALRLERARLQLADVTFQDTVARAERFLAYTGAGTGVVGNAEYRRAVAALHLVGDVPPQAAETAVNFTGLFHDPAAE